MQQDAKRVKSEIRNRVWRLLEERGVARFPRPVYGRIPNFAGAERAAELLFSSEVYRSARVVKVNPDSPQRIVRLRCLSDGKLLVVPTPRIRDGFLLLDPSRIPRSMYSHASTIAGSYRLGRKVEPEELPEIDLIVIGSVAVSRDGWRLGKGEGYAELEYAVLRELGKVSGETPIATTIHELQLVESIPHESHDVPVDYIFTNSRQLRPSSNPKPSGIIWDALTEEKLEEIPILRRLSEQRRRRDGP